MKVGLLTDAHLNANNRDNTDSLKRLLQRLSACDMIVNLGDTTHACLHDGRDAALRSRVKEAFAACSVPMYTIAGNHDTDDETKDCLYSAEPHGGRLLLSAHWTHFFLDACYTPSGQSYAPGVPYIWNESALPEKQLAWLAAELRQCENAIIYIHQPLALSDRPHTEGYTPINAAETRALLERSGVVRMVLQGHFHYRDTCVIGGIPYITLPAVHADGTLQFAELDLAARYACLHVQIIPEE